MLMGASDLQQSFKNIFLLQAICSKYFYLIIFYTFIFCIYQIRLMTALFFKCISCNIIG